MKKLNKSLEKEKLDIIIKHNVNMLADLIKLYNVHKLDEIFLILDEMYNYNLVEPYIANILADAVHKVYGEKNT